MRACIFNIQKFSLHDGPGVRTTVFFKGCPLRCAWCANPESLRPGRQVLWSDKTCVGCGACAAACPASAIELRDGAVVVDHTACQACGECVNLCPAAALTLSGDEYTVGEVAAVCLRDKDFYEESGGGVTLSGGEATMQGGFVAALLDELRGHGVHTALETNGYAASEAFRRVASKADMLLFDVKHYDEAKHLEGTGVSNRRILDNLRRALAEGMDVLVRIPVIRSYNDGLEDAAGFARLLTGMGVARAQLLPFHQMGQSKYAMLGMAYALGALPPLRKEDLLDYREVMRVGGVSDVIV